MVLESARVGAWTWDPTTGEITDVGSCARLLGLKALETMDDLLRAVHPGDRPCVKKALADARQNGRLEIEFRVQLPDGALRIMRATGSLLPAAGDAAARLAGAVIEVTERNHAD